MSTEATAQLMEELKLIEDTLPADNPATRRIAIRSMFASIEALAYAIMESALKALAPPRPSASHAEKHKYFLEICALSELSYEIKDDGELKVRSPTIRFQNRVLFALRMRAKASGVELKPNQLDGWNDFLAAVKTRNRITHPRTENDLVITKADYETATKGFQWVIRCNHRASGGTKY